MTLTPDQIRERYASGAWQAWRKDAAHAAKFAARNPTPTFAAAAPQIMQAELKDRFLLPYLWASQAKKWGKDFVWKPQHQQHGTCVGQSHKNVASITMAVAAHRGEMVWQGAACVCANYAGGRVEIGGQPGGWDGSTGSWAAEWYTKYGVVLMSDVKLDENDLTQDEELAVQWASSRSGVPSEIEAIAKVHPIKNASLVNTPDEAAAALSSGHVVNICSELIPSGKRDKDGFSPMSPVGGHSTMLVGYNPALDMFDYLQSWGPSWASGTYARQKDDPKGLATGCVVGIRREELAEVLRVGDSYTFSGPNGYPTNPDDFFGDQSRG